MLETTRRALSNYERQLRVLRSDYENLPPGTEAAAQKRAQWDEALREAQKAKEEWEGKLSAQRAQSLSQMGRKINALIEQHAKTHGLDLVLKKRDWRLAASRPEELNVVLATMDVLYASERLDITESIVKELNAQYPGEMKGK